MGGYIDYLGGHAYYNRDLLNGKEGYQSTFDSVEDFKKFVNYEYLAPIQVDGKNLTKEEFEEQILSKTFLVHTSKESKLDSMSSEKGSKEDFLKLLMR